MNKGVLLLPLHLTMTAHHSGVMVQETMKLTKIPNGIIRLSS